MTIPWKSSGRRTHASRVAESLIPIGVLPRDSIDLAGIAVKRLYPEEAELRKFVLRILGSAIQLPNGNLLTPRVILDQARRQGSTVFVLLVCHDGERTINAAVPVVHFLPYIDPRSGKTNTEVDAMLTMLPGDPQVPFQASPIHWGDSTELGVGDSVMVAGYPMGSDLFFDYRSNRGLIQPTVYSGTIGAIVPSQKDTETRLLRITVPGLGGLSGGVVFNPKNGTVLGMLVSATHAGLVPQPVLYAIPSEALEGFSKTEFRIDDRAR